MGLLEKANGILRRRETAARGLLHKILDEFYPNETEESDNSDALRESPAKKKILTFNQLNDCPRIVRPFICFRAYIEQCAAQKAAVISAREEDKNARIILNSGFDATTEGRMLPPVTLLPKQEETFLLRDGALMEMQDYFSTSEWERISSIAIKKIPDSEEWIIAAFDRKATEKIKIDQITINFPSFVKLWNSIESPRAAFTAPCVIKKDGERARQEINAAIKESRTALLLKLSAAEYVEQFAKFIDPRDAEAVYNELLAAIKIFAGENVLLAAGGRSIIRTVVFSGAELDASLYVFQLQKMLAPYANSRASSCSLNIVSASHSSSRDEIIRFVTADDDGND